MTKTMDINKGFANGNFVLRFNHNPIQYEAMLINDPMKRDVLGNVIRLWGNGLTV